MNNDLRIDMVPRDLYYHEKAYVNGLEQRIKELEAALATVRELRAYDRGEIERLRNLGKEQNK